MPPITTMVASNRPTSRAKRGFVFLWAVLEASFTLCVYQRTPREYKEIARFLAHELDERFARRTLTFTVAPCR